MPKKAQKLFIHGPIYRWFSPISRRLVTASIVDLFVVCQSVRNCLPSSVVSHLHSVPAGCAPIILVTQALSHFNYSLSSGPTIHHTVCFIYVVYNVLYLSLWLHCDVIQNFKEHTNALTVIYLFAFRTSNLSSNMYNELFYIPYLVMDFIDAFWYLYCIPNFLASCFCSSLHENIVILQYITRWSNFTFYFYLNYFWKVILLFTWVIFSTL